MEFSILTKTKKAAYSSLPTILPKNLLRNNEVFSCAYSDYSLGYNQVAFSVMEMQNHFSNPKR